MKKFTPTETAVGIIAAAGSVVAKELLFRWTHRIGVLYKSQVRE